MTVTAQDFESLVKAAKVLMGEGEYCLAGDLLIIAGKLAGEIAVAQGDKNK